MTDALPTPWVVLEDHVVAGPDGQELRIPALDQTGVQRNFDAITQKLNRNVRLSVNVANVKDPEFGPSASANHGAIGDGLTHPLSRYFTNLAAARAVYPFANSLDEELDWAASQKAIVSGRNVYWPSGVYMLSSSLDCRGISNREFFGDGVSSQLFATAAIDGSDANHKNDIFNFVNFVAVGSYLHDCVVRDLLLECDLQNPTGIPGAATGGYNLCGVEFQNVNRARAERLFIKKAYGNGVVSASIDPGVDGAVEGCIIQDCIFQQCVQGILPQYGIAGSVIQVGAMNGGEITSNVFLNAGGPAIDWFSCRGTRVSGNYITGIGLTVSIGTGQTVASIHSDFGLTDCILEDNRLEYAGPIFLNGLMVPVFFNDNTPTPGPQGCTIRGNKLFATGTAAMTAPSMPASGGSRTNTTNVPVLVRTSGGTGVAVVIDGNPKFGSGQNDNQYIVPPSAVIQITYATAPTWAWFKAPNALLQHIVTASGNAAAHPLGQCLGNQVTGNVSWAAPISAVRLYDSYACDITGNTIIDPGEWDLAYVFESYDTAAVAGTGTMSCTFSVNTVIDTRPNHKTFGSYNDNTAACVDNAFIDNRVEAPATGANAFTITSPATRFTWRDNHGPGLPAAIPVVAAAASMELPLTSDVFSVTGSAVIATLIAGRRNTGRTVHLIFAGVSAISNGTDNITLPGTFNWFSRAGDVLSLSCDGATWRATPPTPTGYLTGTAAWNPPNIPNGGYESTVFTVADALPGDTVACGFSDVFPGGIILCGVVSAAGSVCVSIFNFSGAAYNPGAGTVRADVFQH